MHVPTRESFGGSFVSPDVADVFHFMFGAQDHDSHVQKWRVRQRDMARDYITQPFRTVKDSPFYRFLKKHGAA